MEQPALGFDSKSRRSEEFGAFSRGVAPKVPQGSVMRGEQALIGRDTNESPTPFIQGIVNDVSYEREVIVNMFNDVEHEYPAKMIVRPICNEGEPALILGELRKVCGGVVDVPTCDLRCGGQAFHQLLRKPSVTRSNIKPADRHPINVHTMQQPEKETATRDLPRMAVGRGINPFNQIHARSPLSFLLHRRRTGGAKLT